MTTIIEDDVEQAALDWLRGLGCQVAYGSDIALETCDLHRFRHRGPAPSSRPMCHYR